MDKITFMLSKNALKVARKIIGWRLYILEPDGSLTGGMIIETEAYTQDDAASHSYRGKTKRNEIMFGPAGFTYVYFTYGMHWCMNIVAAANKNGEAVLIRAIKPEKNIELMRQRRNNRPNKELTNGPAKVCQALAITGKDNGLKINKSKILLKSPHKKINYKVLATKRIGIKHDSHRPWRFIASF
jgi:DNA-3-methyladenine glycosylase